MDDERAAEVDRLSAVGMLAVVERVVINPHVGGAGERDVVVRGVPVAERAVGGIPLREAVEGILERDVPDDHVLNVVDAHVRVDDARIGSEADQRRIAREVDANPVLLLRVRGDAGRLERTARNAGPSPGRGIERHEVRLQRIARPGGVGVTRQRLPGIVDVEGNGPGDEDDFRRHAAESGNELGAVMDDEHALGQRG